jgi:hypothetical protein
MTQRDILTALLKVFQVEGVNPDRCDITQETLILGTINNRWPEESWEESFVNEITDIAREIVIDWVYTDGELNPESLRKQVLEELGEGAEISITLSIPIGEECEKFMGLDLREAMDKGVSNLQALPGFNLVERWGNIVEEELLDGERTTELAAAQREQRRRLWVELSREFAGEEQEGD